jgi:hypothetical protein
MARISAPGAAIICSTASKSWASPPARHQLNRVQLETCSASLPKPPGGPGATHETTKVLFGEKS